ncbi:hypothetical protein F0562_021417 [Nyssa sinensis]|uniref:S-adenosyl-L-methionine-dependent methyltransferase n=1 Tax=Nyssa sinensis TaxID=561372 RepID=A0A5J5BKC9_9ASTE|nr:hypothetical protein F0562_021417 [Nyssa sinensis]
MESLAGFAPAPTTVIVRPSRSRVSKKWKNAGLRAKLDDEEDDPQYRTAIYRASLRFQETLRPEPLFVDAYAGCFISPNIQMDMKHHLHRYCLATKYIDDKLLSTMKNIDGLKQVVLLTDGMDTRPYRLSWPTSTIIFHISPERVFKRAAQKLEDVGAKIPRSCLLLHVPLESSDLQEILHSRGFNGNRPSIWVFQGLPVMTLASFEEILFIISSLAMKGCLFLGELPTWLAETEVGIKSNTNRWIDQLFMSRGFRIDMISYNEVARNLGKEPAPGDYKNILFVAEHLRFSDDQMETWRREFQRVDEDGDEEGFEEL